MPRAALAIGFAQRQLVAMPNGKAPQVARRPLMRKFADQVPCGGRTEFPAGLVRQAGDIIVQLTGGQIRCPLEQVFALVKGDGKVVDQTVFDGIRAHRVGSAEIGLPLFEHRTEIQIDDVVVADAPEDFARALGEVARAPAWNETRRRASAARAYYDAHFSAAAYEGNLERLVAPLLA